VEELERRPPLRALPGDCINQPPAVADLLRQLLAHLDERSTNDQADAFTSEGQDILLDIRLDGHYYTLARTADMSHREGITLSPRETEIVRMVARGLPTKAIANVLDVILWTVSTHLRRVFAKLQVNSRAEMVARALAEGLI
jgi:DNA-binding CsgD family transcriptional regulator